MMVAYPHLGSLSLVLSLFFSYLGVPFLSPSANSQDALQKGSELSPEEMCVPFKIMAGNLVDAYERGADAALMVATCGPCRLGEYGQLLKEVLDQNGYHMEWILLDSPSDIGKTEFVRRFRTLTDERSIGAARTAAGLTLCIRMIRMLDALRRKAAKKAGYLEEPYEAVRLLHETHDAVRKCASFAESFGVMKEAADRLKNLTVRKDAHPIKILVAGEIYTSIEEEGNRHLEEKLMKLGCSVERHIDLTWWIGHSILHAAVPQQIHDRIGKYQCAPCNIGGYGRETIRRIARGNRYDGIIKIMPSGCMPEIVTKAYFEAENGKRDRRILHLVFDEMSGEAGYDTRIEAFIDMLERRRYVLVGDRRGIHQYRSGADR